ncbi:MAG TPA: hypothetical protein PLQ34_09600 [Ferrovaceae bacterium]|nr:hypothetical protein [Ferrovaceae bacterium]
MSLEKFSLTYDAWQLSTKEYWELFDQMMKCPVTETQSKLLEKAKEMSNLKEAFHLASEGVVSWKTR